MLNVTSGLYVAKPKSDDKKAKSKRIKEELSDEDDSESEEEKEKEKEKKPKKKPAKKTKKVKKEESSDEDDDSEEEEKKKPKKKTVKSKKVDKEDLNTIDDIFNNLSVKTFNTSYMSQSFVHPAVAAIKSEECSTPSSQLSESDDFESRRRASSLFGSTSGINFNDKFAFENNDEQSYQIDEYEQLPPWGMSNEDYEKWKNHFNKAAKGNKTATLTQSYPFFKLSKLPHDTIASMYILYNYIIV